MSVSEVELAGSREMLNYSYPADTSSITHSSMTNWSKTDTLFIEHT